jgi:hypothetical protein
LLLGIARRPATEAVVSSRLSLSLSLSLALSLSLRWKWRVHLGVGGIVPGYVLVLVPALVSGVCVFLSGFNILFSGHGFDVFE